MTVTTVDPVQILFLSYYMVCGESFNRVLHADEYWKNNVQNLKYSVMKLSHVSTSDFVSLFYTVYIELFFL